MSYYRFAAGVDVVPLHTGGVLLRSDAVSVRLDGEGTSILVDRVFPLLDGTRTGDEIAEELPGLDVGVVATRLEELATAGVLIRCEHPTPPANSAVPVALTGLLEALGLTCDQAEERLRTLRVAVFGMEGAGAQIGFQFAACGIGALRLVDPHPCTPGDLAFWPGIGSAAAREARHTVVARDIQRIFPQVEVTATASDVTRDTVRAVAAESDLLVCCFDRGFSAARLWVNRAALEVGVPALFCDISGASATAGPLVVPGESACFLCWRMRALACSSDFRDAMAYEEFLDKQRRPELSRRLALPPLAPQLAGTAVLELLKTVLGIGQPQLVGAVVEMDGLAGTTCRHVVLQRPDCPACTNRERGGGSSSGTGDGHEAVRDLHGTAERLVSARCGVVRSFSPVVKDPSEPELPIILRAELANQRFQEDPEAFVTCSGKGFTADEAGWSALGEAVERYSASAWSGAGVRYAARPDLDVTSLDPRRLVLFHPTQYRQLRYAPYRDGARLGWVEARRWGEDAPILVPALAVYMSYDVAAPEEFLFPITSNGLAAGPSLERAVLSAALEVAERDAFLSTWYHRLPGQAVDPRTHPDSRVIDLCEAYARRGIALELYRLRTDHVVHVFLGVGVADDEDERPAVVVGLGADLDPAGAARSALLEVAQVRPALRIKLRNPEVRERMERLRSQPGSVESLEDHDLLYAHPGMRGGFDFLRGDPVQTFDWDAALPTSSRERIEMLAASLRDAGSDLLFVDVTPNDISTLGLHAARAILPDFQPIHFGERERRLGGDRLFEFPMRIGLRATRASLDDLNPFPHPLA